MRATIWTSTALKALTALIVFGGALNCSAGDWLQFRGNGTGAAEGNPPATWDVKSNKNVAWRAPLEGRGVSAPIVVGDRVIVTTNDGVRQNRLGVACFDSATGKQLWKRQFWATGRTVTHPSSAVAAPSPASDGKHVFAFYSSNDLVCLDLDGNLKWYRGLAFDYPKAGNDIGMSSSPVVVDQTVIVQIENQGDSFAMGVDSETGETRWRIAREPVANWCSPTVMSDASGKAIVLLQSPSGLTAHQPQTGKQLWHYNAECSTIPSAATVSGSVFVPANGLTLLRVNPDSSAPQVVWDSNRLNPSSASPVLAGDFVFVLKRGVLAAGRASDGELVWQQRVSGSFWASPVVAGGHLYLFSDAGKATVLTLKGEQDPEVAAEIELGEGVQATPAVSGDAIFVRSDKHLWKFAATK